MQQTIYVGLDVHAESITAAILEGDSQEAQVITLASDLMKVRALFRRLAEKGNVRSCYEASGAGFVLQRTLTRDGFSCDVIAPSLIPRRPGDRRKTDRLDAIMLARLYRSGHLTPVHIPTESHEALRRLLRLRSTYHAYCTATKHRLSGMLRNHGYVFREGRSTWTKNIAPGLPASAVNSKDLLRRRSPSNSNILNISNHKHEPSTLSSNTSHGSNPIVNEPKPCVVFEVSKT